MPPDAILSLATPAMAIGFNGRTVIARCVPRISSVVPHSSALRLRHDVSPYSALLAHPCSTLASLSALAPSFLPLRSSVIRHATTCSGSCSYGAVIVSYVANRSQSCLFSRPLRSRFLCLRPASWPVAFSAMPAASSKLSGCSAAQTACLRFATTMRSQPHMILLLAYLPGWYLREKEIV